MNVTAERPDPDALLTPGEVAELFDVTPKTVGRWHDAGILDGERTLGGHRRFRAGSVYELLDLLAGGWGPFPSGG